MCAPGHLLPVRHLGAESLHHAAVGIQNLSGDELPSFVAPFSTSLFKLKIQRFICAHECSA